MTRLPVIMCGLMSDQRSCRENIALHTAESVANAVRQMAAGVGRFLGHTGHTPGIYLLLASDYSRAKCFCMTFCPPSTST